MRPAIRTGAGAREQRFVTPSATATLSLREKKGDAPAVVEGYGALFGQETVIQTRDGRFREVIAPGAFGESVAQDDIRVAFNHNANFIIGRTSAKTATVTEDQTGLKYSAEPPDAAWARDMVTSIKRRDITGSSFQFEVPTDDDEEWDFSPMKRGGLPLRTIKRARLWEVGPVAFPAYETTTVSARAIERVTQAQTQEPSASADPSHQRRDLAKVQAELRCCMDYYETEAPSWMETCRRACASCIAECAWTVSACAVMVNDPTCGAAAAACLAACRVVLDACTACLTACAAGDEMAAGAAAAACQAACEACAPLCTACAMVCATMPDSDDAMACMSEAQYCSSRCTSCVAACAGRPASASDNPGSRGTTATGEARTADPGDTLAELKPDVSAFERELELLERE